MTTAQSLTQSLGSKWWAHEAADISPLLAFVSPEKRCDKTTAFSIIGALVPKAMHNVNITTSVLFRGIEIHAPTMLIDEADTYLGDNDELRAILNGGHNRLSAYVWRSVGAECCTVESSVFGCTTPQICLVENIGKNHDLTNPKTTGKKENPVALAGATGAYWNGYSVPELEYQTNLSPAMALCLAIVKCVKAEGRVKACEIMAGALDQYALEWPIAPMFGLMDQASFWADMATQAEAKAYALACYNRLTPANQAAFNKYTGGRNDG